VCRRFEVEAAGEESLVIHLERTGDGRFDAWSQGREVLSLPPDERYAPAPPVEGRGSRAGALDLAILVDGTTRVCRGGTKGSKTAASEPAVGPLLADEGAWRRHADLLVEIAEGLAKELDLQLGVFAFGDRPADSLRAPGLRPSYELHPQNGSGWKLEAQSADALRSALLAIPPTSGGDFVDALGESLAECVKLPWREEARRVVMVTGDSPGYSILDPAPAGANLLPRHLDVDTQVLALHKKVGVEVATVYHVPPPERRLEALGFERALLEHAATQYRRLASRRELAFEAPAIEASDVVLRLLDTPRILTRGPGYGVLLEAPRGRG
jgi:hypothetical protein